MSDQTRNLNHLLLANFSGQDNSLHIPKLYLKLTGCLNKAYLLNQIVYYSDKSTYEPYCKHKWFYKTYEDWQKELPVSDRTLRTYFKEFENEAWIEMRIVKIKGIRTPLFRPNLDNILTSLKTLIAPNKISNNEQKDSELPQTEIISELDENVAKRKKFPDSQTEKISVSNTIYTEDYVQKTTTTENPSSSSIFFNQKEQSLFLSWKLKSDMRSDELFLKHCEWHFSLKKGYARMQQVDGLSKILEGCFHSGEHFKAQDFPGDEPTKPVKISFTVEECQNRAFIDRELQRIKDNPDYKSRDLDRALDRERQLESKYKGYKSPYF